MDIAITILTGGSTRCSILGIIRYVPLCLDPPINHQCKAAKYLMHVPTCFRVPWWQEVIWQEAIREWVSWTYVDLLALRLTRTCSLGLSLIRWRQRGSFIIDLQYETIDASITIHERKSVYWLASDRPIIIRNSLLVWPHNWTPSTRNYNI